MNIPSSYELIKEEDLGEIKTRAYLLRHKKSGARVLLMDNDDENKVFAIGFRTPVSDSTGVPHILEHSVLCGSKKYPVSDPFMQLSKSSLNTFLNAMTFADKTLYPVASCNDKDLDNLMSVYLDAVFNPNIYCEEKIFRQEGHRLELESKDAALQINGVVYSEMKGCFSDADAVLDRYCQNTLFPDTTYGYESGGDPKIIPTLTYEEFINFHKKYYHPSNSYIYLYGDMDHAARLEYIDREYLSKYDKTEIDSKIELQKPFDKLREYDIEYPISADESAEGKAWLSLQWVTGTNLDNKLYFAMQILEYALLCAEGSPLRDALIKSGLGEDVFGGWASDLYQPFFKVTLKNTDVDKKDAFIKVVEDTLRKVCEEGLDKRSLKAAINNMEFRIKEADFGSYPKGLIYSMQALESWLYDDDEPVLHLHYKEAFDFYKESLDTRYFESIIEKYFLDNNHKTLVTLIPNAGLAERREAEGEEELAALKASLSDVELEKIIEDTKALREYQEREASEEELATLPHLELSDIERSVSTFDTREIKIGDVRGLHCNTNTNGITYLKLSYDVSDFTRDELLTLELFKEIIGLVNTKSHTYGELSDEINLLMGGLELSTSIVEHYLGDYFRPEFSISSRYFHEKADEAIGLISEITKESIFDDKDRIIELLKQIRSHEEMKSQGTAHTLAVRRALSYEDKASAYREVLDGITYLRYIGEVAEYDDAEVDELIEKIKAISKKLFDNTRLFIAITDDEEGAAISTKALLKDYSTGEPIKRELVDDIAPLKKNEGFKTTSQVNYVAMCGSYKKAGEFGGGMHVLRSIVSHDYLWNNIRVKGGAYGALFAISNTGNMRFVSYRDPNIAETIEAYKALADTIETIEIDERELTDYKISVLGSFDQPLTPVQWGSRALGIYNSKTTDEYRQKIRDEVFDCTLEDIRAFAPYIREVISKNNLCVIGSARMIEAQSDSFDAVENLL